MDSYYNKRYIIQAEVVHRTWTDAEDYAIKILIFAGYTEDVTLVVFNTREEADLCLTRLFK